MARQLRINFENALYHVLSRGNQRNEIFADDQDRLMFLEGLKESAEIFGVSIISYVLMKNHYHFIVETPNANLSKFMKHFNITYAARFNKRHKREGHLFQGRFKSIIVEEDPYLVALSRYLHLNPIRTSYFEKKDPQERLSHLLSYRWSTLPGYLTSKRKEDWVNYDKVLSQFGKGESKRRKAYLRFIKEALADPSPSPFAETKYQVVLGSDSFVEKIRRDFLQKGGSARELPALRQLKCLSPDQVIRIVAEFFGEDPAQVTKRGSGESKKIAMDFCYKYTDLSQEEIGKAFENVDYSTVSMSRKRLKEKMKTDKRLASAYAKIDEKLYSCQK